MCCSYSYGFLTSKSEPFLTMYTTTPTLSSQYRFYPVSKISFPCNPIHLQGLKNRVGYPVGSGYGLFRTRAAVQDTVSVLETCCFYDLLGIPKTGSQLEIKQAYKQLVRKYHPDVSPPDRVEEYTQRFIRVQEAYEILSDPNRRALYDRDIAKGLRFARRRYQNYDDQMEEKSEWKSQWQNQVSELKRRSHCKDAGNMSWGARMRRQHVPAS